MDHCKAINPPFVMAQDGNSATQTVRLGPCSCGCPRYSYERFDKMIIWRPTFWQCLKLMFGCYLQIELWPRTAQSYSAVVYPPWVPERVFRDPQEKNHEG